MAVEDISAQISGVAASIPGIKKSWDKQPESLNELPAALVIPNQGTLPWPRQPSIQHIDHQFKLVVLFSRADLTQADTNARPYIDQFIDTFDQHITLGGTVQNSGIIKYHYGHIEYAGVSYLGIEFILQATERKATTYAP